MLDFHSCNSITTEKLIDSAHKAKNIQLTSNFTFWGSGATRAIEIPGIQPNNIVYCSRLISVKDNTLAKDVEIIQVISPSGTDKTQLILGLPNFGWWWSQKKLALVAFSVNNEGALNAALPTISILKHVWVSPSGTSWILAFLVTGIFYSLVVLGMRSNNQGKTGTENKNHRGCINSSKGWIWWNPVALTAGYFGQASLSKLQLFCFTLVVLFRVIHLISRDGILSGLSTDILLLLGISAGGAGGAKLTGVVKKRLSLDNWAWLRRHKWLTIAERGDGSPPVDIKDAKWGDLIKTDGLFDVYSFQLAGFSLIVAAYLLFGVDLATFTLPPNILSVLGLSNVVYLGGKAVEPNSYQELDDKITDLQQAESALLLVKKPDPNNETQKTEDATLKPEEYTTYILKARKVAEMLRALYGDKGTFGGDPITDLVLSRQFKKKDQNDSA